MNATTLAAAVAAADTQIQLSSGTGVTARGSFNRTESFALILNPEGPEIVEIVSTSSPQSTTIPSVRRGLKGTKVRTHPIGTPVQVLEADVDVIPEFTAPVTAPGAQLFKTAPVTIATATAVTLTPADILSGLILQDSAGGAVTTTLPTAALLVAALPDAQIGTSFRFTIRNTSDAAETNTVAAGTGGTLSGTATIAQNNSKEFLVRITGIGSSAAYTCYSLGTVVH